MQSFKNLKHRVSAVTGAAITIMARINVDAVSLPMPGYTQARTSVANGGFQALIEKGLPGLTAEFLVVKYETRFPEGSCCQKLVTRVSGGAFG